MDKFEDVGFRVSSKCVVCSGGYMVKVMGGVVGCEVKFSYEDDRVDPSLWGEVGMGYGLVDELDDCDNLTCVECSYGTSF
jgi:hypothetical protein